MGLTSVVGSFVGAAGSTTDGTAFIDAIGAFEVARLPGFAGVRVAGQRIRGRIVNRVAGSCATQVLLLAESLAGFNMEA